VRRLGTHYQSPPGLACLQHRVYARRQMFLHALIWKRCVNWTLTLESPRTRAM
jgi:hypothetical protein